MLRRIMLGIAVVLFLGIGVAAQAQDGYLDTYTVQVKPEKHAQFDAISKKIAAANRQNKGDTWIASETIYGEQNTISFVSARQSYADMEKAASTFYAAMAKAFGEAGAEKLFQEFSSCIVSSHGTARRRRMDLSTNAPADPAAQAKLVGNTRWIRLIKVYVRPGQALKFEDQLRTIKAAVEKSDPTSVSFVSQSASGDRGTIYYISQLRSSMAGFDAIRPLPEVLGEEGYRNFLKLSSEIVQTTETSINRLIPEISNPPEETAAAAPDFWRPKPPAPPKPPAAKAPAKKQ